MDPVLVVLLVVAGGVLVVGVALLSRFSKPRRGEPPKEPSDVVGVGEPYLDRFGAAAAISTDGGDPAARAHHSGPHAAHGHQGHFAEHGPYEPGLGHGVAHVHDAGSSILHDSGGHDGGSDGGGFDGGGNAGGGDGGGGGSD
jgi:hypothetical protein